MIVPPPNFAVVVPRVVFAGSEAPSPVTVKLPAPVLFDTMPLVAPLAEMLRNVSPLAPIVVLATLSAVAVVVVMVLPLPVALIVPPPVAEKPAFVPVLIVSVPLRLIVALVLPLSVIPEPLSLMWPPKPLVPPVWLAS